MAVTRRLQKLKSTRKSFYRQYLQILSILFPIGLTETEIDVLNHLYLQGKVLTKETRRRIREGLRSGEENLNNFISKLGKKGFIIESNGVKSLNPKFFPPEYDKNTVLQLEFTIEDEDESVRQADKEEGYDVGRRPGISAYGSAERNGKFSIETRMG